jgi:uncharacterized membrane protein YdjX (TVP38/TMEM64 family)
MADNRTHPATCARHTQPVSKTAERGRAELAERLEKDPVAGGRPSLVGVGVTLVGIAIGTALVLAIEPLRTGVSDAVQGDTDALRSELRDLGVGGALIVLALALVHAVVWYPAEILDAAAGFVFGFWVAAPLVMAGWVLNALVAYWIGRHAARPVLFRFIGRERFLGYERLVNRGGVTLLLAMRLIPIIPFSLFSYVAGSARVPVLTFTWTTAVGYIPITALFVYLGSELEELSLTDPVLWIGGIALIALLLLIGRVRAVLEERADAPPRSGGKPAGREPA